MSPIASAMARASGGGFNPLSLSTLVWLLHPDDATDVISSEINSLVCRKLGATFTAPASSNRMPLDTTERSGHKVAKCATNNADYLRCDDATVAGALNGGGAFTAFWFRRRGVLPSGGQSPGIQHSVNTLIAGAGDRWEIANSGSGHLVKGVEGASSSSWNLTSSVDADTTTWHFEVRTYDGAGHAELFIDNVSAVTDTQTARSPTGLLHVLWGGGQATTYWSVSGVCTGVMNATDRTNLYNWVLANA